MEPKVTSLRKVESHVTLKKRLKVKVNEMITLTCRERETLGAIKETKGNLRIN